MSGVWRLTRKRSGEWTPALAARYPDIESRTEILALARFFRACHDAYRDPCRS